MSKQYYRSLQPYVRKRVSLQRVGAMATALVITCYLPQYYWQTYQWEKQNYAWDLTEPMDAVDFRSFMEVLDNSTYKEFRAASEDFRKYQQRTI